jgi:hypothetical protein
MGGLLDKNPAGGLDVASGWVCRSLAAAAGWLAVVLVLAGCQPKPDSYYPLTPKSSWRYVMSGEIQQFAGWQFEKDSFRRTTTGHDIDNFVLELKTQPTRPIEGREATPIMSASDLQQGFWFSFWVRDANGFAEVARQKRGAPQPRVLDQPVYILHFPIAVGTSWDTTEPTDFLDGEVTLRGTARIASIDDSVTVPAGTFRRCVRVESDAAGSLEVDGLYGNGIRGDARLERQTTLWLAPDVGAVKFVSSESATPASLGSGAQTLELVEFSTR